MWNWLFGRRKETQPLQDSQHEYYWLSQPYHADLMLIKISSYYPSCIAYTEALVRINKVIKSNGEIINYMVYHDESEQSLHNWLLDSDGFYHHDVPKMIREWRRQCDILKQQYQSLQAHSDYRKQCESKLLVHLVENIVSLDSHLKDIRLS